VPEVPTHTIMHRLDGTAGNRATVYLQDKMCFPRRLFLTACPKKSDGDDIAENRERDSPGNATQQYGEYGLLSKFAELGQYLG